MQGSVAQEWSAGGQARRIVGEEPGTVRRKQSPVVAAPEPAVAAPKQSTAQYGVRTFEILLATVMAAKGTSFIFSKMLLEEMGTFTVLAVRFLLAFALLGVIFARQLRRASIRTWLIGVVIGVLYFVVMALELTALTLADSGAVALVEHTSIVMVPIGAALVGHYLPRRIALLSALVALVGVGLLTAPSGGISPGYAVALVSALAYTITIIATARLVHTPSAGLAVGIIQLGVLGILALTASFIFERPQLPSTGGQWAMMAMLVLVCTAFGFTGQVVAQSRVSAELTGLLAALNPAVAAVLGAVVLGERFGWLGGAGLVLVLVGITLPYWRRARTWQKGISI